MLDELVHILQSEDFATSRSQQLLHVLPAHAEAASRNTGHHLESGLIRRLACQAERAKVLHSGYLVPRGAVILGELRFDEHLGVELVWNREIRRLVETWQTLCSLGLAKTDTRSRKHLLDRILDDVAHQLTDRVAMSRKGAAEKTFIKQHGIRHAEFRR